MRPLPVEFDFGDRPKWDEKGYNLRSQFQGKAKPIKPISLTQSKIEHPVVESFQSESVPMTSTTKHESSEADGKKTG